MQATNATDVKPPLILRRLMFTLAAYLIFMQAADGLSTHMALATGLAEEKNTLLVSMAVMMQCPVTTVVFAAKLVTAVLFAVAMVKTTPNWWTVAALVVLSGYVTYIVAMNFFWAWILG